MVGARRPRHPTSHSDPAVQEAWKKTSGSAGNPALSRRGQRASVRLMFQDEARFGRMVRIGAAGRPSPNSRWWTTVTRDSFNMSMERQPCGRPIGLDDLPVMNTEQMGKFFVSSQRRTRPRLHGHGGGWSQFPCGQGAGGAGEYSPAPFAGIHQNSTPRNMCGMRSGRGISNRVFADMSGVVRTLETGLPRLAADTDRVRSLCAWPWIVSLNLKAH